MKSEDVCYFQTSVCTYKSTWLCITDHKLIPFSIRRELLKVYENTRCNVLAHCSLWRAQAEFLKNSVHAGAVSPLEDSVSLLNAIYEVDKKAMARIKAFNFEADAVHVADPSSVTFADLQIFRMTKHTRQQCKLHTQLIGA